MRPVRLDDERRRPVQARRRRATTSRVRRRCARSGATSPRHATTRLLIAERCEVEFAEGRNLMPRFPVPDGETEETWFVKEVEAGLRAPLPRRRRRRGARARADFEVVVILQMGFPGYFLVTADFIMWAKQQGIRVGPGRGSAAGSIVAYAHGHHRPRPARARPAVRAVPQPRAHLDARHRHRLRRAPSRRGHPLRHRQVRRRPRRADRHLRHDQGQAGDQGRLAGARLPVRDGRPHHQGDAARRDGQGHPAQRHFRPRAPPLRRGRRVPQPLRLRRRREAASSTPHASSRTSSGSGASTRPASSCRASR